jgi:hypothetical protein
MAFSLALLALRSVHSSSQGARHIPLIRTVFRHAKLSKIFRESFDLTGKLPAPLQALLGYLDPKVPATGVKVQSSQPVRRTL